MSGAVAGVGGVPNDKAPGLHTEVGAGRRAVVVVVVFVFVFVFVSFRVVVGCVGRRWSCGCVRRGGGFSASTSNDGGAQKENDRDEDEEEEKETDAREGEDRLRTFFVMVVEMEEGEGEAVVVVVFETIRPPLPFVVASSLPPSPWIDGTGARSKRGGGRSKFLLVRRTRERPVRAG